MQHRTAKSLTRQPKKSIALGLTTLMTGLWWLGTTMPLVHAATVTLDDGPVDIEFEDNCDDPEIRSFVVTDDLTLTNVQVGLNLEHKERGQIEATLVSPKGTRVPLIASSKDKADDYDVLLDSASTNPIDDGNNDDTGLPLYDRTAAPESPLTALVGESSQGTWLLEVCNDDKKDKATYQNSRLILTGDDDALTLDLDGDDDSGASGNDFTTDYTIGGSPTAITDSDTSEADDTVITNPSGAQLSSAVVTLTTAFSGDQLVLTGSLPAGISATTSPTQIQLSGTASLAAYETALELIQFSTSSTLTNNRTVTLQVTDTDNVQSNIATTTITVNLPPPPAGTICYLVADAQGSGNTDLLTRIDLNSGTEIGIGTGTGTDNIESIAFDPFNNRLYAVDQGTFGEINVNTGQFSIIGSTGFGDIDGLAVDPFTGQIYASVRNDSGNDLLIQINPATGAAVPDAFGPGQTSVPIPAVGSLADIDDITVDPVSGQIFGIANDGGSGDRLVQIDRLTGASQDIGALGVSDMEGFSSFNNGLFYGTTGSNDALYIINPATGNATFQFNLGIDVGNGTSGDYEAADCFIFTATNSLSGRVFLDQNGDGTFNGADTGTPNVTVNLYRDVNGDGVLNLSDDFNGDGVLDDSDIITSQVTNGNGDYNFILAATGAFIVTIDTNALPPNSALTTNNGQNFAPANFGNSAGASITNVNFGHRIPPMDYGDAPASFGTNTATHVIDPDLFLGATPPDAESSPSSPLDGTGDDVTGTDDEDGVTTFPQLIATATSYSVDVTVTNNTSQVATLTGWIDFNNNGSFEANEAATTTVAANGADNGPQTLTWSNLSGLVPEVTDVRLRLTTDSSITPATPTAPASDGEIEDHTFILAAEPLLCRGRPITALTFSNPSLESGPALQVGALYRFADVTPGLDALVSVDSFNNGATLAAIDGTVNGIAEAFQPELSPVANGDSSVDFTITFVVGGTTTPTVLDQIDVSGIDIDGNSVNLIEYIELTNFDTAIVETPTALIGTLTPPTGRFEARTVVTQPGISFTATDHIVTTEHSNASTIGYRIGAVSFGGTDTRLNSLFFGCVNYNAPQPPPPPTPELFLAKRLSAIERNGINQPITSYVDVTSGLGAAADNAAGWPDLSQTATQDPGAGSTPNFSALLQGDVRRDDVLPNDRTAYRIYFMSGGTAAAQNVQICDFVPVNSTYVPNSLRVVIGNAPPITITDSTTDSQPTANGGFFPTGSTFPAACTATNNGNGAVSVNLGTLIRTIGTGVPAVSYGYVEFEAMVD